MKKLTRLLSGIALVCIIAAMSIFPTAAATIMGDVNADGLRNAEDLTCLKKMLLGSQPVTDSGKVNSDDDVDIRDLISLKKLLTDPSDYWVSGTDQGHDDIFPAK